MNDEYTLGWNEMKSQALNQCVLAGSDEAYARINSLKEPIDTPEPVKPEAEPNWQELESALWAARSQTNEIANRGIDRVVSFLKKLHERTEPKVCHCSCKDGQRACESWKEAATQDVADSLRKTGLFSSVTIGLPAPDLTEEELNALANYGIGSISPHYKRLISELRRRRSEMKIAHSILDDMNAPRQNGDFVLTLKERIVNIPRVKPAHEHQWELESRTTRDEAPEWEQWNSVCECGATKAEIIEEPK